MKQQISRLVRAVIAAAPVVVPAAISAVTAYLHGRTEDQAARCTTRLEASVCLETRTADDLEVHRDKIDLPWPEALDVLPAGTQSAQLAAMTLPPVRRWQMPDDSFMMEAPPALLAATEPAEHERHLHPIALPSLPAQLSARGASVSVGTVELHAEPLALRASDQRGDGEAPHRHELEPFQVAPAVTAPMSYIATDPQQPPDVGSVVFPAAAA